MLFFRNDYSNGAHPQVMEALCRTNLELTVGYGLDPYCRQAEEMIRRLCNCPQAQVHFLAGGTQANKTALGGGIVIKNHANKAYITDGLSSATVKTVFENAGVKYQTFFNRSDVRSGSTLGAAALRHTGMLGADIGLAQLAMHSACECFAKADYAELVKGVSAFYGATLIRDDEGVTIR